MSYLFIPQIGRHRGRIRWLPRWQWAVVRDDFPEGVVWRFWIGPVLIVWMAAA